MSTVIHEPRSRARPHRWVQPAGQVTLDGISWEQYLTIADALPDRPGLRITYDGEHLELMTTSQQHERFKKIIGRMIEMLSFELRHKIVCGGNVTFRRHDLRRGLEPDECYWIRNHAALLGVSALDLTIQPPPDLVLEIDVSSRSVERLPIYALLGVPEVWRFDPPVMEALILDQAGTYRPTEESLSFPGPRPSALMPFVLKAGTIEENELLREFVGWVRQQDWASPV